MIAPHSQLYTSLFGFQWKIVTNEITISEFSTVWHLRFMYEINSIGAYHSIFNTLAESNSIVR